jgi:RNA polymerase sigma-70 factor (ECF subfamily)
VEASRRALIQDALTRLGEGDREAFTTAFHALWPLLFRFTCRYLPPETAEDVAQQALLNLFSRADEFDRSRSAVSFAIGIAFHEMRSARRRIVRKREDPIPEGLASAAAGPHEVAERRELEELLDWGLAQMSPDDRATLQALLDGAPAPDVAPATFRKRVQRAKERLRAILKLPRS